MSKKGFKNAPHIAYFATGMQCTRHGNVYNIISVQDNGDPIDATGWILDAEDIATYTVALDSVWVGREYRSIHDPDGHASNVFVRSRTDDWIGFVSLDSRCVDGACWSLLMFCANYEPVPPEQPAVSAAQAGKQYHIDVQNSTMTDAELEEFIRHLEWLRSYRDAGGGSVTAESPNWSISMRHAPCVKPQPTQSTQSSQSED